MATASHRLGGRDALSGYAALVRLPNLCTAPPDVIAGAAVASVAVGGAGGVTTGRVGDVSAAGGVESVVGAALAFAGLALASVLLYAGGTALNDYVDFAEDVRDRPERPLPSGAVSRERALGLATVCLLGGVLLAGVAGGVDAAAVAGALALVVVAYDARLKEGSFGPLAMGAARGLNVALGLSLAAATLPPGAFAVPLIWVAYVAGVTHMADEETRGGDTRPVVVAAALAVCAAAAATAAVYALAGVDAAALAAVLALGFLAWDARALGRAYRDPVPGTLGPAVGVCVLGLVPLSAAVAAAAGPAWALAAVGFLAPARLLAAAFDVS